MNITNIVSLLGGVALFLFGMSLMGDGLKSVAGNKLELVLYKLTSTPIKGLLLGTALGIVTLLCCKTLSGRNYLYPIFPFNFKDFCKIFVRTKIKNNEH